MASIELKNFIPTTALHERLFPKKGTRGKIDVTFLILVLILLTFGLVMLLSASYAYAF